MHDTTFLDLSTTAALLTLISESAAEFKPATESLPDATTLLMLTFIGIGIAAYLLERSRRRARATEIRIRAEGDRAPLSSWTAERRPNWTMKTSPVALSASALTIMSSLERQDSLAYWLAWSVLIISATHLAAYAVFYVVGGSIGRLGNRLAFDDWESTAVLLMTVAAVTGIYAADSIGGITQFLMISSVVMTCWIRHHDMPYGRTPYLLRDRYSRTPAGSVYTSMGSHDWEDDALDRTGLGLRYIDHADDDDIAAHTFFLDGQMTDPVFRGQAGNIYNEIEFMNSSNMFTGSMFSNSDDTFSSSTFSDSTDMFSNDGF